MSADLIPVFDGHNDTLLRLVLADGGRNAKSFLEAGRTGHLDLPRARKGGFCGGLFAMFTPSRFRDDDTLDLSPDDPGNFAEVSQQVAEPFTRKMIDMALAVESLSAGEVVIAHSVGEARQAMADGKLAMILHIEGVECLSPDLSNLHTFYQAGLRSLGPVWSRKNAFADGVPMDFPGSPDTGSGLNAHAISQSPRNLTDRQLEAVRASGGLVGINFHVGFLRPDGVKDERTDLDQIVAHTDHLLEKIGEDGVAFGSDFDGCMVPAALGDAAGMPRLIERYRQAGYGETLIRKIAAENWLSLLERTGL